jgi:formate-nitrite transporter family protein
MAKSLKKTSNGSLDESSPDLAPAEREQAAARAAPRAVVIHEILREEGEIELKRTPAALLWSALAGGLSMGFSFITLALLRAKLPDSPWSSIVASVGYSTGFVIVILGKQQLFTETTLTATLPLLVRRDWTTFVALMRMWAIVLLCNLVGTLLMAWLIARPGLFDPEVTSTLGDTAMAAISGSTLATVGRAMLAGWLIALMVWVLPGADATRFFVIVFLTSIVSLGNFPHIVAGSTEAAYAIFAGRAGIGDYVLGFFAPTLLGNTIGGVALAAMLNHAPVLHDMAAEQDDAK